MKNTKKKKCLNDMPNDINAQDYKLKLPAKALAAFRAYAGGEPEMYAVGPVSGYAFMMSPDAPGSKERRMYPLPESLPTKELLKWTVVQ